MMGVVQTGLVSILSALVFAGPAASQDDDWELVSDPARNLTAAAVRYDDGRAVVAQCAPAGLRIVLIGLPATTQDTRVLSVQRADGRSDTQTWFAAPGATAFTASVTGRDARFLRGGGRFEVASPAGSTAPIRAVFDLPAQNANLDHVLATCGYATDDQRDLLPRADETLKSQWAADHAQEIEQTSRPRMRTRSRSVSGRGRPRTLPPAPPPTPTDISCLVRGGALTECRYERPTVVTPPDVERRLRALPEIKLEPVGAAANEGRVYYPFSTNPHLIQVIREVVM